PGRSSARRRRARATTAARHRCARRTARSCRGPGRRSRTWSMPLVLRHPAASCLPRVPPEATSQRLLEATVPAGRLPRPRRSVSGCGAQATEACRPAPSGRAAQANAIGRAVYLWLQQVETLSCILSLCAAVLDFFVETDSRAVVGHVLSERQVKGYLVRLK